MDAFTFTVSDGTNEVGPNMFCHLGLFCGMWWGWFSSSVLTRDSNTEQRKGKKPRKGMSFGSGGCSYIPRAERSDILYRREGNEPHEGKGEPPEMSPHETDGPRFQCLIVICSPIAPGAQLEPRALTTCPEAQFDP